MATSTPSHRSGGSRSCPSSARTIINLSLVLVPRLPYPQTRGAETARLAIGGSHLPRMLWVYSAGAMLVAAGLADYPLTAFHFGQQWRGLR
jgi:hypothetical protein